jgi:hypothetical protein
MKTKKKEEVPFPSFKKRELNKEKIVIRKVHKRVVAPPGE